MLGWWLGIFRCRCCGFNAFHMDSLGVAERLSDKIATCHGDGLRGWFMALFYPQKNLNYSSLQLIHVHYVMFPVIAPECCAATCFNILQDLHDLTVSLKAQAARCRIQRWDAWTYFHGWSENQSLTTLYNLRWLHMLSSWQIGFGCRRPITGAVLVVCIMWCLCCQMSCVEWETVLEVAPVSHPLPLQVTTIL